MPNIQTDIDFIVTWVDGSDPQWQSDYAKSGGVITPGSSERYRDWGLIRYFFRSVAKFAPWVNMVHFVTYGHLPDWLNTECQKLNIVRHEDYIPSELLPTFNSNAIELNFHRIPELAEHFVVFNDDILLLQPVNQEVYFHNGLPRLTAGLFAPELSRSDRFYVPFNNASIINSHFSPRACVTEHPLKWLNPCYGIRALQTLCMLPYPSFRGFFESHLPTPYMKSTFAELWEAEETELAATSGHRFRESTDVSIWLMKNWQCAKGEFYPCPVSFGRAFFFSGPSPENTLEAAVAYLRAGKGKAVCLNDGKMSPEQCELVRENLLRCLDEIFPDKCEFEL